MNDDTSQMKPQAPAGLSVAPGSADGLIARLRAIAQDAGDMWLAAVCRESADEIERLRDALLRIVSEAESDDGLTAWDGAEIARAALCAPNA